MYLGSSLISSQIDKLLDEEKEQVHYVIELSIDAESLSKRVLNRLIHLPSGRIYHLDINPPKEPGKDDVSIYLFSVSST